jgi:phosphatidylserine decarboxylase
MISIYDRKEKRMIQEKVYGSLWVDLFYSTRAPGILHQAWVQKLLSALVGLWQHSPFSRISVNGFVKKFGIKRGQFLEPKGGFSSFHDFFVRQYKKDFVQFPEEANLMGSPCEGRLSVFPISNLQSQLFVKGVTLSLQTFLQSNFLEENFEGGHALVFRLCPVDYHRFHFPDSGIARRISHIGGGLHSVNPVALKMFPKIFLENERVVTEIESESFGKIYYVEVGALCVGKIRQTFDKKRPIRRGDEKGYFTFGASTVVLLLERNIKVAADLIENTQKGFESLVRVGEVIAKNPTLSKNV